MVSLEPKTVGGYHPSNFLQPPAISSGGGQAIYPSYHTVHLVLSDRSTTTGSIGCNDPTESSVERQGRSPRGWHHSDWDWESNPGPATRHECRMGKGDHRSALLSSVSHIYIVSHIYDIYCLTLSGRLPRSCRPRPPHRGPKCQQSGNL